MSVLVNEDTCCFRMQSHTEFICSHSSQMYLRGQDLNDRVYDQERETLI